MSVENLIGIGLGAIIGTGLGKAEARMIWPLAHADVDTIGGPELRPKDVRGATRKTEEYKIVEGIVSLAGLAGLCWALNSGNDATAFFCGFYLAAKASEWIRLEKGVRKTPKPERNLD